ncbi:prepilin-type N-terminal cleavage/methylation domain-containing protein [Candidatus Uhrbacteria bacterium]|nr:prepilin-type N-terminal cleavage/methylation domain-containing protein [Candidatus Uhrbacteria bacterium]
MMIFSMPKNSKSNGTRTPVPQPRGGFTLIEMLTVVSLIGVLSSIAVVSYQSARSTSRDIKRMADMKGLQVALDMFYGENGYYPSDGQGGQAGTTLETKRDISLSDAGFGDSPYGRVYMSRIPVNAVPGGIPYTYRSLAGDGGDCDSGRCASYAIIFGLEKDRDGLAAGPNAVTPEGFVGPDSGYLKGVVQGGRIVGLGSIQGHVTAYADRITGALEGLIESKAVQDTAEIGIAPAAAAAAVANVTVAVGATAGASAAGQYLLFFLTQPVLLFGRRRRRFWGTVYNSLSRLPEDLAIVRIRDFDSGRVVRSEVTDSDGRYSFLMPKGRYRIEVVKGDFSFPSVLTGGKTEDGPYLDVYHGEEIVVGEKGISVTKNIPIDPRSAEVSDATVVRDDRRRRIRSRIALVSPILGMLSLLVKPSVLTVSLAAFQVLVYLFFRRLANPTSQVRNWGTVYEEDTGRPVYLAVVRIFALPYHKLLESKVTDRYGRYNFRVGSNRYYVIVSKDGFLKTETDEIDFSDMKTPSLVAADLPLRREGSGDKVR